MNTKSLYELNADSIEGENISLAAYKGKKMLIVNTASKCGFTPQYKELQKLHELHGDKVAILGFPSNNFLWQEPGSDEKIALFCERNYGVTFQLFSKTSVKGSKQHPLFQWLSRKELNGWNSKSPSWNFCKYLVDEKGALVKFYPSSVSPMDKKILEFVAS